MKRSGRHFGVPDRMLFLCPNTRRDNKIAENAGWDRERCWPSSCLSSPSYWCSKASTLRSPGRKSSLLCPAGNVGSYGLGGGSNPPSPAKPVRIFIKLILVDDSAPYVGMRRRRKLLSIE
jgi:hypothetical protein